MCRMLGLMCNDEDLLECAIQDVNESLRLARDDRHDGVGVGYYSGDDPLLRKRPSDLLSQIDFRELVEGIRSNVLLVHVRRGTVGAWKDANTHPFRFRRWLFAHVGTLSGLDEHREEILRALPPFLARNVRGETESELAFHRLLDELFKDGKLNDLELPAGSLADYLLKLVAFADEHRADKKESTFAMLATNGQVMAAVCRGIPMHYSHREGIQSCKHVDCDEESKEAHLRFKGIMLGADMSDPGHQWREVADSSVLTVSHDLELKVRSF
ncbi:MAG: class II glutamine amidotransferase [Deltaproteobacteria bacterium]|nr:class II glutamine amidotransferase [Deltaproteobacteria bacterium]